MKKFVLAVATLTTLTLSASFVDDVKTTYGKDNCVDATIERIDARYESVEWIVGEDCVLDLHSELAYDYCAGLTSAQELEDKLETVYDTLAE